MLKLVVALPASLALDAADEGGAGESSRSWGQRDDRPTTAEAVPSPPSRLRLSLARSMFSAPPPGPNPPLRRAESATRLVGRVARLLSLYRASEVVVFEDGTSADAAAGSASTSAPVHVLPPPGEASRPAAFLMRLLECLECPPSQRTETIPRHTDVSLVSSAGETAAAARRRGADAPGGWRVRHARGLSGVWTLPVEEGVAPASLAPFALTVGLARDAQAGPASLAARVATLSLADEARVLVCLGSRGGLQGCYARDPALAAGGKATALFDAVVGLGGGGFAGISFAEGGGTDALGATLAALRCG